MLFFKDDPKGKANSKEVYEPSSSQVRRGTGSGELPLGEPEEEPTPGRLNTMACKVLMKVFYAARAARFDLYRPVAHLARFLTKWTVTCDKKLYRLMCYIRSTLHYRMVGMVRRWPGLHRPARLCRR